MSLLSRSICSHMGLGLIPSHLSRRSGTKIRTGIFVTYVENLDHDTSKNLWIKSETTLFPGMLQSNNAAEIGLVWTTAPTPWEAKHASLSFSITTLSSLFVSSCLSPHRLLRFMHWFTWHLQARCHGELPWEVFQELCLCWVPCAYRESE